MSKKPETHYCSFCSASQHDVMKLIVGPAGVAICSDCITGCVGILFQDASRRMVEGDLWAEVEQSWMPIGAEEI